MLYWINNLKTILQFLLSRRVINTYSQKLIVITKRISFTSIIITGVFIEQMTQGMESKSYYHRTFSLTTIILNQWFGTQNNVVYSSRKTVSLTKIGLEQIYFTFTREYPRMNKKQKEIPNLYIILILTRAILQLKYIYQN